MPIYEYFCRTCNTRYEKLRSMNDADAPIDCPSCQEQNSVRTLSLIVVHSSTSSASSASMSQPMSGGCCGGACGCGHQH